MHAFIKPNLVTIFFKRILLHLNGGILLLHTHIHKSTILREFDIGVFVLLAKLLRIYLVCLQKNYMKQYNWSMTIFANE